MKLLSFLKRLAFLVCFILGAMTLPEGMGDCIKDPTSGNLSALVVIIVLFLFGLLKLSVNVEPDVDELKELKKEIQELKKEIQKLKEHLENLENKK